MFLNVPVQLACRLWFSFVSVLLDQQHVSDSIDRTEVFNPEYCFKAEISPLNSHVTALAATAG